MADTRTQRAGKGAATAAPEPAATLAAATVSGLTAELVRELRRPFTVAAIRFKPQTVTKDNTKAMATFYIDARLAAERLNHVVGPEGWQDTYRPLFETSPGAHREFQFPVECTLTVLGTTKVDVGNYQKSAADEKAVKSAYSDAMKRAAVKFGVGAYLYAMPKVWAPVKLGPNGKVQGFSDAGERQLRQAYEKACAAIEERFGAPLHHGETDEEIGAPEEPTSGPTSPGDAEPVETPAGEIPDVTKASERSGPPVPMAGKEQVLKLKALAEQAGYTGEQIVQVFTAEHDAHGGYRQAWVAEQNSLMLEMIEHKAGKGKRRASGDTDAPGEA